MWITSRLSMGQWVKWANRCETNPDEDALYLSI